MTRTPSTSIVAVHAGTVKAASRRCAVAPQSGGASLDGPRAQSQGTCGRDEETPFNRTKKRGSAKMNELTHTPCLLAQITL